MQPPTQEPVSPRAKLVALAATALLALLGAAACADDGVPVETESASTTAATSTSTMTETQAGSVSDTGPAPVGWPRDWYGEYYEAPGLTLGLEYQEPFLIPGGLKNMRLDAGEATLERFGYEVDDGKDQWTFSTERDGDVLRLLPPGGSWDAPYPGAEDVLIRPGAGCDELMLEVRSSEPIHSTRWRRGSLCVIDPHDDSIANDEWMVDLCPGSVSSCDGG